MIFFLDYTLVFREHQIILKGPQFSSFILLLRKSNLEDEYEHAAFVQWY
jgi:hypothetical protein